MIKFTITVILIFTGFFACSQTFQIKDQSNLSNDEITVYKKAIESANLENYRNKSTNQTIEFDNGLKVELISAKELIIKGYNLNINQYQDTRNPEFVFPKFHLHESGYLIALYQKIQSKP